MFVFDICSVLSFSQDPCNPPMTDILWDAKVFVVPLVGTKEWGINHGQMLIIYAYTYESDIYRVVNKALRLGDQGCIEKWSFFIYWLEEALAQLPRYSGEVYRGIGIVPDKEQYAVGREVTWSAFSSTSVKWKVAHGFLTGGSGMVFAIRSRSGREIQQYSYYNSEAEVLFPPSRRFRVIRWCKAALYSILSPENREWNEYQLEGDEECVLIEMEEVG